MTGEGKMMWRKGINMIWCFFMFSVAVAIVFYFFLLFITVSLVERISSEK